MPREYQKYLATYAYIDDDGLYALCFDNGRYMNHSCEPTSLGNMEFDMEWNNKAWN